MRWQRHLSLHSTIGHLRTVELHMTGWMVIPIALSCALTGSQEYFLSIVRQMERTNEQKVQRLVCEVQESRETVELAREAPVQERYEILLAVESPSFNLTVVAEPSKLVGGWRRDSRWDGERWVEWVPLENTITISSQPHSMLELETDCAALFSGIDAPTFVGGRSLSSALECCQFVHVSSEKSGAIEAVFWLDPDTHSTIGKLTMRTEPAIAVDFCAVEIGPPGRAADSPPSFVHSYSVEAWASNSIEPAVAFRDATLFENGKVVEAARSVLRAVSSTLVTQVPRIENGLLVDDQRAKIKYVVGGTEGRADAVPAAFVAESDPLNLARSLIPAVVVPADVAVGLPARPITLFVLLAAPVFGIVVYATRRRLGGSAKALVCVCLPGVAIVSYLVIQAQLPSSSMGANPAAAPLGRLGPLEGPSLTDLGVGWFDAEEPLVLHASIPLRNLSGQVVRIQDVKASCGCTVAKPDREQVQPGDTLRLDTAIRFASPGHRREKVWLLLENDAPIIIEVEGVAMRRSETTCLQSAVNLVGASAAQLDVLVLSTDLAAAPPPLEVVKPQGVEVKFGSWQLERRADFTAGALTRWRMTGYISRVDLPVIGDTVLLKTGNRTFGAVELTGRVWAIPHAVRRVLGQTPNQFQGLSYANRARRRGGVSLPPEYRRGNQRARLRDTKQGN